MTSSTMKPVTPCSTISGAEPRLKATTGVPQAIASIITRPNGSGQSIGVSKADGAAQELRLARVVDLADELDVRRVRAAGAMVVFEIVGVRLVDLRRDFQRQLTHAGDVDRAIEALSPAKRGRERPDRTALPPCGRSSVSGSP